jgi:PIN domain nuclease of toxin-antitoxin system
MMNHAAIYSDPFDPMPIAQAMTESLRVIAVDVRFANDGVSPPSA